MSGESDLVDKLAQSIADGDSINWEEIDELPADPELRQLFKLLRLVANVADVHRSPAEHVTPPVDEISTKPPGDQPPGSQDPAGSHCGIPQAPSNR